MLTVRRQPSVGVFGYRLQVPLALTTVALVAGVLVAATTYALVDRHVQANAEAETQRLAATLARAMTQPVLRGDVWQAYEMLRAATPAEQNAGIASGDGAATEPESAVQVLVLVLDAEGRVFASPTPRQHPVGQHHSALSPTLAQAARQVLTGEPPGSARVTSPSGMTLVLAVPILGEEEALLGVLLASHPRALTQAQRDAVVRQLLGLGALAVLVVALAGGALGWRMVQPLARLRTAMSVAPRRDPAHVQAMQAALAPVRNRRDEVGELGRSFAAMLEQIAAQQELERHMLQAERMASIGQLTAGIAHEVNNPLGGMLAAIENRRLRGGLDEASARTLGMLERGLQQVHATVQALLNEARSERHPLTAADLGDLDLLLRPEADHARCALDWQAAPPVGGELPAVPVRQVLLNLTLNAIAAAGRRGHVRVRTVEAEGRWRVQVGNSGQALDAARLEQLIQGQERAADGRLGLGLWITARIVHTLGGRLRLADAQAPELPELPDLPAAVHPSPRPPIQAMPTVIEVSLPLTGLPGEAIRPAEPGERAETPKSRTSPAASV